MNATDCRFSVEFVIRLKAAKRFVFEKPHQPDVNAIGYGPESAL